ncbi:MAG: zinc-binding dehydrogenase [Chloroflexi bacterium]|nr:zinc-binding dehydrogenase [Chloroflexota bacterium]MCY3582709.1 zinc-binding dehydrogenase [Chloroflexota bacterium]MCY3717607.1 zinc-binding dehydrogenase [Chloroflexota bacterium]MDE2650506.1 zinc-binding dehydrogenase [Chloroflexota bacterium]MXV92929.1 zinc-binding dehydrogenase [Chloroflexota bacterium]
MAKSRETMRTVIIENIGKPRVLKLARRWLPQPAPGEALIKVHATSVNPRDLHLRSGRFLIRKPLPHILGRDLAGTIARLGAGVDSWQVDERVVACFEDLGCAMDGAYAEYCCVPAARLARLPEKLDFQTAVGAGAAFADASLALMKNGRLQARETVVIRGAACSLGAAAAQIAKQAGARVIAISPLEQAAGLQNNGADIVLEDAGDDLVRQVKVATDGAGANMVLQIDSQKELAQSLAMLAARGRLVLAGAHDDRLVKLDASELVARNLRIQGAQGSLAVDELECLLQRLADGEYRAVIDEALPLSQARQAHQVAQKSTSLGKIVLVPDSILAAAQKPDNWVPIT